MALYDLRSQTVHGSKISNPKNKESELVMNEYDSEYLQLKFQTRRTLNNYIGFINTHNIKNKNSLFGEMQKTHEFLEVKNWFIISFPDVANEIFNLKDNEKL